MMACQEMTEACLDNKDPNPGEIPSEAVHQEVPKEGATAKSSGALKKGHGGWKLATGHCRNCPGEMVDPRRNWLLPT